MPLPPPCLPGPCAGSETGAAATANRPARPQRALPQSMTTSGPTPAGLPPPGGRPLRAVVRDTATPPTVTSCRPRARGLRTQSRAQSMSVFRRAHRQSPRLRWRISLDLASGIRGPCGQHLRRRRKRKANDIVVGRPAMVRSGGARPARARSSASVAVSKPTGHFGIDGAVCRVSCDLARPISGRLRPAKPCFQADCFKGR